MGDAQALTSAYDSIARLYDPWSRSVVEDVAFYVEEASQAAPGPIVELGVGRFLSRPATNEASSALVIFVEHVEPVKLRFDLSFECRRDSRCDATATAKAHETGGQGGGG